MRRNIVPGLFFALWLPILGLVLLLPNLGLYAAETVPTQMTSNRPKIGLVLSGGGARGAAHVGVIRVLEELHVPIDYIAGTSMGAIVGGLYASGMGPDELEQAITSIDWDDAFKDLPPRQDRPPRRKRDDDLFVVKQRLGYGEGEIRIPSGIIQGQKINMILVQLTLPVAKIKDFDQLNIPFRAVASDIVTGQQVVLKSGNLAQAMRASMSIPGILRPEEIDGYLLVDGGVSNNLPISVVRQMGAEVVIVVDISTPLAGRDQLNSALAITKQLTGILTRRNTEVELKTLTKRDILIVPDLGDIQTGDFGRVAEAIPFGVTAANAKRQVLKRLAIRDSSYTAYKKRQSKRDLTPPVIDFVRINNQSKLSDEVIAARLTIEIGQPLDVAQLEADIGRIYGLELFERVAYEIIEEDGQTGLVLHVIPRSWGPNFVQFGLIMSSNFEGDNRFNLSAALTRPMINGLNGEWRMFLTVGDEPAVGIEVHQPLDVRSRYFVAGRIKISKERFNKFDPDELDDLIAEYRISRAGINLSGGREFGTWGEIRLGLERSTGDADVRVGAPSLPDIDFDNGEYFVRLSADKLDNVNFPRSGGRATLEWRGSRENLGADTEFDQVLFKVLGAKTWGRNTLLAGATFNTTKDDDAPIQSLFRAGGFTDLSGFQKDQLSGQHFGVLWLGYLRRINDVQLLPAYLGATIEVGNVWQDEDDISLDNTINAGSLFLGVDSPLGPLYLGYGYAEGGHDSLFMFLGRLF